MNDAGNRQGYRGYISARPILGEHTAQHVQNLVIRDYARRRGLAFKLSAVEYAMPACYLMLEGVLEELPRLEGVLFYSIFQLPQRRERRLAVYQRVLATGGRLIAALESQEIAGQADVARVEDIWLVRQALPHCQIRP